MEKHYNWKDIQECHNNGKSWRELREIYGVSYPAISKAIKRGDFISRNKSDARRLLLQSPNSDNLRKGGKCRNFNWSEIQKFYDDGHTFREVSKKFNISQATLASYKNKGIFKSKTRSDAIKIARKKYPESYILSTETKNKISKSRIKYLTDNPSQVPYILNHYSKGDSYPEKYFEECLRESPYVKKYRVGLYELDFADVLNKIDLEIDGDQHFLDSRIVDHDIKRNNDLIMKGWKIIRIKWSDFQKLSRNEKENVVDLITNQKYQSLPSVALFGF